MLLVDARAHYSERKEKKDSLDVILKNSLERLGQTPIGVTGDEVVEVLNGRAEEGVSLNCFSVENDGYGVSVKLADRVIIEDLKDYVDGRANRGFHHSIHLQQRPRGYLDSLQSFLDSLRNQIKIK